MINTRTAQHAEARRCIAHARKIFAIDPREARRYLHCARRWLRVARLTRHNELMRQGAK